MICLTAWYMDSFKYSEIFKVGICSLNGTVFYDKHKFFYIQLDVFEKIIVRLSWTSVM